MSQMRAGRVELRAIFAVMAVCALFFGMLVSGSAQAFGVGGPHFSGSKQLHAVACRHDLNVVDGSDAGHTYPTSPINKHAGHGGCPDCCREAQTASAILPERLAAVVPLRAKAAAIDFPADYSGGPEGSISKAVNGARAPPVLPPTF